jgi:hypothetical protein
MVLVNSSLFMSMSNFISINIYAIYMNLFLLICLFTSIVVDNEKGEIIIKIRDNYQEWSEIILRRK